MPHLLELHRATTARCWPNDHTILISHTAGGILSSLTGRLPRPPRARRSRTATCARQQHRARSSSRARSATGPIRRSATHAPAEHGRPGRHRTSRRPGSPYTRAGCDVGAVATANIVLENTGTGPSGDVTKVFGNRARRSSPRRRPRPRPRRARPRAPRRRPTSSASRSTARRARPLCASGQADLLPAEPGGYAGFNGLFGAQAINPLLTGQPATRRRSPTCSASPITDPFGQPGFPGFDGMSAAVSLAYVAAMQEHGIPVTYAYISDAHDFHGVAGNAHTAYGPGSAGYVAAAARPTTTRSPRSSRASQPTASTRRNTLFVFTVDEGDHFVGGTPDPRLRRRQHAVRLGPNQVGEINANIDTLVTHQFPALARAVPRRRGAERVHRARRRRADVLPREEGHGRRPARRRPTRDTRTFERDVADAHGGQPVHGQHRPADGARWPTRPGMKALHMFTAGDPARNADVRVLRRRELLPHRLPVQRPARPASTRRSPGTTATSRPEIATHLARLRRPRRAQPRRVERLDRSRRRAADDAEPARAQRRLRPRRRRRAVLPRGLGAAAVAARRTGRRCCSSTPPTSSWTRRSGSSERTSSGRRTAALASGSSTSDTKYTATESKISTLTAQRDDLAAQIQGVLDGAEFGGQTLNDRQALSLSVQAGALILRASLLAALG